MYEKTPLISIAELSDNQIPDVLNIADKQLGEAYLDIDKIKNKDNTVIVAIMTERVVGFCIGKKTQLSELKIHQLDQMNLPRLQSVKDIGLIATIATDPKESGKGVGTKLFSSCISRLENLNLNNFVMTGWKSYEGVNINSLAKKFGFKEILEIPEFWYEDSKIKSYCCPSCGEPPCRCSAVIYMKHPSVKREPF